jgi:hypothetical protein
LKNYHSTSIRVGKGMKAVATEVEKTGGTMMSATEK